MKKISIKNSHHKCEILARTKRHSLGDVKAGLALAADRRQLASFWRAHRRRLQPQQLAAGFIVLHSNQEIARYYHLSLPGCGGELGEKKTQMPYTD